MNRRDFLLTGAASAAGLSISRMGFAAVSQAKQKVIVIGAGLSGLVAAYELGKAGNDVKVLEAQARPGGRVLTIRDFSEGLNAEAGAARIPENHDLTLRYVKEFSLQLIPFYPTDRRFMRFSNGRPEAVDWRKFADATSFVMGLDRPEHWQKIKGGNDLLPKAFADRLGTKVAYETPVVKIAPLGNKVAVTFTEKGRQREEECDRLICAIPFTMLAKIEVSPGFSQQKRDAINSLTYDSASRLFVETKRRFWEEANLNGFGFGDDFAEIWNSSFGQPGTHGILQRYLRGGNSESLAGKSEAVRAEESLVKLSAFFPEIRANFVKSYSKVWSEDPWVLGAWGHQDGRRAAAARAVEGRVHFAGEHLSDNASWMQGALQSGLRAVDEVRAAANSVNASLHI